MACHASSGESANPDSSVEVDSRQAFHHHRCDRTTNTTRVSQALISRPRSTNPGYALDPMPPVGAGLVEQRPGWPADGARCGSPATRSVGSTPGPTHRRRGNAMVGLPLHRVSLPPPCRQRSRSSRVASSARLALQQLGTTLWRSPGHGLQNCSNLLALVHRLEPRVDQFVGLASVDR